WPDLSVGELRGVPAIWATSETEPRDSGLGAALGRKGARLEAAKHLNPREGWKSREECARKLFHSLASASVSSGSSNPPAVIRRAASKEARLTQSSTGANLPAAPRGLNRPKRIGSEDILRQQESGHSRARRD